MLVLVGIGQIGGIMDVEEDPFTLIGPHSQQVLKPGFLLGLGGQPRINDLRIHQDESAVAVIEGLVMGAEMFLP